MLKRYRKAKAEREKAEEFITKSLASLFEGWDDIRKTADCRHSDGTGKAPGDGKTHCGFCN